MAKTYQEALRVLSGELEKHIPSNGNYTGIEQKNEDRQGGSNESSAPSSSSAQVTAANKIAARANSSAKTPTSSRSAFGHAHRTPGSAPKPLSQLKPVAPKRPSLIPPLAPKMSTRK